MCLSVSFDLSLCQPIRKRGDSSDEPLKRLDEVRTALSVVIVSWPEIYRVRSVFMAWGNVKMIQPLELANREIMILERNRSENSKPTNSEGEGETKKGKKRGGPMSRWVAQR